MGKIEDIFNGQGITEAIHTKDNMDGVDQTINYGLTWAKRAEPLWKENLENKQKAKEEKNKKENNDCLIKN